MKRTFLSLIFCTVLVISNSYAALNPYAYGLSSQLSDDKTTLTVNYSLNAPATSVVWKLVADGSVVKTIDLSKIGRTKGSYTTEIPTTDFPGGKSLTWKVEVIGESVAAPTIQDTSFKFYLPYGLDCDVDPESDYLGNWYVIEAARHNDTGYVSDNVQRGLYAFDATLTGIKNKNGTYGFTGGMNVEASETDKNSENDLLNFYRVATSGGRVFIGRFRAGEAYHPIVEANPADLDAAFTSVYTSGEAVSIDAIGHGENLKIVMLTKDFKVQEFDLGTAKSIASPTRTLDKTDVGIVRTDATIAYDNEGGVWFNQHRWEATTTCATIAHLTANGVDYHNVKDGLTHNQCSNSGIAVSPDGKQLAVVGAGINRLTIYAISKDNTGKISLNKNYTISTAGSNHTALTWDYAGNLYVANRSAKTITFYAMPYSGTVATPAASKYAFSISKYTMTVTTNDENKGTVSGGGEYREGDVVTLTATPKPGYKLLYWSDRSTENPRTITMTKNEALSAYFVKNYVVEPIFTIEKVWENTNVPKSAAGYQAVGWDGRIYMQNKTEGKIKVYNNGTDAAVDYAASNTSGQQIAVDEAGNLIVFNNTFYTANPSAIQIYQNGSPIGKEVSFTLPNPGRCDFISASGDIYSPEGGYVYFYCDTHKLVNRVKITNGAESVADVSVDGIGNTKYAATSVSHVMVDIFGNLAAHCRSNAVDAINIHTGETTEFNTSLDGIKLSTLGGCSFELGGKEFWAYNVGTNHYNSEWNLYNMTDKVFMSKETLYVKDKDSKKEQGLVNWLNVQVEDEHTAYIYQFCPEVAVAVWKVTMHEVVLRDTANNEELLKDWNNSTTNVFVYRSLTGGMYNTLCLPFNVTELNGTPLANATVWQYNGATVKGEGTSKEIFLDFTEVTSIAAGQPYLVEPAEDIAAPMEFKNVTISVTNGSEIAAHTAVTMHGILHPTELEENNKSILFLVANNNLAWANETANMNGMRAYFQVNDPSLLSARTRAYIRREPTVATEMEAITTSETEIKKVIYNGNIYIIRGDEVYTIQGTKVK